MDYTSKTPPIFLALSLLTPHATPFLFQSFLQQTNVTVHPYMILIAVVSGMDDTPDDWSIRKVICQGSLVSPAWVLTASHCRTLLEPLTKYYALGHVQHVVDVSTAQRREISQWIPFGEDYKIFEMPVDDILLCKLRRPFSNIKLIELPKAPVTDLQEKQPSCQYVGWMSWANSSLYSMKAFVIDIIMFYELTGLLGMRTNVHAQHRSELIVKYTLTGAPLLCDGLQVGLYLKSYRRRDLHIYTKIDKYTHWIDLLVNLDLTSKHLKLSWDDEGSNEPFNC